MRRTRRRQQLDQRTGAGAERTGKRRREPAAVLGQVGVVRHAGCAQRLCLVVAQRFFCDDAVGKVVGQIKVVLSTIVVPNAPQQVAAGSIRLETVTDTAGAWQMPRRVPPGQYELRAAVVGDTDPDSQIFRELLQLQRSSTTLSVPAGQRQVEHHIDLPAAH